MTQFRVIIQPRASVELEQAFLWIAERNSDAAQGYKALRCNPCGSQGYGAPTKH